MRLTTLYIRFFRSFNFDYLRKSREDDTARPDPWDQLGAEELFFPFVRVPLEPEVTTVVGANEAGKSQLLGAIEALLTGEGYVKRDFCRYSTEFNEDNAPELPEFGGEFTDLTPEQAEVILGLQEWEATEVDSFHLFRFHDRVVIYLGDELVELDEVPDALELPKSFRIDARIPLPDSVEIAYLAGDHSRTNRTRQGWLSRMLFVRDNPEALEETPGSGTRPAYDGKDGTPDQDLIDQWDLARRLLIDVAGITPSEFAELKNAVHTSEGYAEALVDKMNRKLADSLNFRRWWTQDRDFALRLRLRDFDLVFTIRDRTGSDYTFKERSQGLKYFLSYFVQYLSHTAEDGEILLMDEPDAFLSNSGQQDLLRIFRAFAHPEDDQTTPVQVVYVTHSPFLIDKNHAERIRVLEKGDGEEGTRVVNNAGRNHYEPLRSSLGGFVAETTFISSCNLMLEGQADPILLAGASAIARKVSPDGDALDLNTLTLVPCGGAGNVSYMVHLARGRDEDKPAVLVLVDNDTDGLKAIEDVKAMKGLLPKSLMFTVAATIDGEDREGIVELEDLVPISLANEAIKKLAQTVLPRDQAEAFLANWSDVKTVKGEKTFKLLQWAAVEASQKGDLKRPLEVEKVPFARSVIDLALDSKATLKVQRDLYENFRPTLALIESKQREAMRDHAHAKISTIIKRLRKNFIADHPNNIRKNEVTALLENLSAQLPRDAAEADKVLDDIRKIQRDFRLADEPRSTLPDPQALRDRLYSLSYGVTNAVQSS
ncbi:AAA family ATPase [Nesterenkonia ebinurensis]|uniref:AAA family ATPase n=1 Tax=Nesterenkonia ebinurensis TaxID=2608252 RepID=UPI00123E0490|nr:AAA family ATPase [Nesterenkonia ebinurensis]